MLNLSGFLVVFMACHEEGTSGSTVLSPRIKYPIRLDLNRANMLNPEGVLHVGQVVSYHQKTVTEVALSSGTYRILLSGEASDVEGVPAKVSFRINEEEVQILEFRPELGRHSVSADFSIDKLSVYNLELAFINDFQSGDADRNLRLEHVQVRQTSTLSPQERAEALREELNGANLILISIDTLRPDHLSAYGYHRETSPNMDALAHNGVRFDSAISASHWTAPSHATMLTGLHPEEHGVIGPGAPARLGAEATTLAERLSEQGYQTGAFTGSHFVTSLLGMDQGFDRWWEQTGDCEPAVNVAQSWLKEQKEPFFLFFHTYQTHGPYDPPAPYDSQYVDYGLTPERGERLRSALHLGAPTAEELSDLIGLYDGDIRASDDCIAKLMKTLEDEGVDSNTLVVLTSDHGEAFLEHGSFGHGHLYPELLAVPLIISHPLIPAVAERSVSSTTGAVDLVPTIIDILGLPFDETLKGRSLVDHMTGTPSASGFAYSSSQTHGDHAAIRTDVDHFVINAHGEFIFNMDAPEQDSFGHQYTEAERAEYRRRLAAFKGSLTLMAPTSDAGWNADNLEALQALGYIMTVQTDSSSE